MAPQLEGPACHACAGGARASACLPRAAPSSRCSWMGSATCRARPTTSSSSQVGQPWSSFPLHPDHLALQAGREVWLGESSSVSTFPADCCFSQAHRSQAAPVVLRPVVSVLVLSLTAVGSLLVAAAGTGFGSVMSKAGCVTDSMFVAASQVGGGEGQGDVGGKGGGVVHRAAGWAADSMLAPASRVRPERCACMLQSVLASKRPLSYRQCISAWGWLLGCCGNILRHPARHPPPPNPAGAPALHAGAGRLR